MASNSRAEKAADKEAAAILASLSRAGEAAIEQTVEDTVKILRADPGLLYHLNALLHNEEWKAVLRASATSPPAESGEKPEAEQPQGKRLRAGLKKFEHLDRRRAEESSCPELRPLQPRSSNFELRTSNFHVRISSFRGFPGLPFPGLLAFRRPR